MRSISEVEHENIIKVSTIEAAIDFWDGLEDDDDYPADELAQWKELLATCEEGSFDELISEGYFSKYAAQYADERFDLDRTGADAYFDYDSFADDYVSDFTAVEFDGVTYYGRG
jgi:hypothetical protein